MALDDPQKPLESKVDISGIECGSGELEHEEKELEKLESDVRQMTQKIIVYRETLPDQLKNTLASILSAQRSILPIFEAGSEPGPSGDPNPGNISGGTKTLLEEQKASDKIQLLKDTISRNISVMPTFLKRVKECISKIDELDSYAGIRHPAFKKRRPS